MKNLALTLCFAPALLLAAPEEKTVSDKWQARFAAASSLRAGETATLDSVYEYSNGELFSKTAYFYNEDGRLKESYEKTNLTWPAEMQYCWKTLYSNYQPDSLGGVAWDEQTFTLQADGSWKETGRAKMHQPRAGFQDLWDEYRLEDGEWVLDETWRGYEYKDGLPTVVIDSCVSDGYLEKSKFVIEYDSVSRIARMDYYFWDTETDAWKYAEDIRYEYATPTGKDYTIRHFVEQEDGGWLDEYGYTYVHDEHGNPIIESGYEVGFEGFEDLTTYTNFYSDQSVTHNESMPADEPAGWSFIPASRTLVIDQQEPGNRIFRLYTINGQLVRTAVLPQGRNEISLATCPSGIYILQVGGQKSKVKL